MLWNVVKIIHNVPHCYTWLDNVVRCNTIVHNVAWYSKITHNVVEEERGQNPRYLRWNGEEREQWIGSTFWSLHWKCSVRFGQSLKALTFSCPVWHHNYPIQFTNLQHSKNPKHFWKKQLGGLLQRKNDLLWKISRSGGKIIKIIRPQK